MENGFNECFNAMLVTVRSRPIITMLEAIRTIVMVRMHTMRTLSAKWIDDICPTIRKRIEWAKEEQRYIGYKTSNFYRTISCYKYILIKLYCRH